MKMWKLVAGWVAVVAMGGMLTGARADCIKGDFNNWVGDDWGLAFNAGNYYALTVQATNSSTEFKFNNGSTWWGAGTSAGVNASIGTVSSGGNGNLALAMTSGQWYTFRITGHGGWTDRRYLVMKTQYKPAVISSVTDNHDEQFENDVEVTVNCELSAATPRISDEEVFYLVYTTDGWATQTR